MNSDESRKRVAEKARKLFLLAQGTDSLEEASAAIEKAYELMALYNLNLSEFTLKESGTAGCSTAEIPLGGRNTPEWIILLCEAIVTNFSLSFVRKKSDSSQTIIFVGFEPDLSIGHHVFEYLSRIVIAAKGSSPGKANKTAWRRGFILAVSLRLEKFIAERSARNCQETALVPVKKGLIERYMDELFGERKKTVRQVSLSRSQPEDFFLGYRAGERVSLSRAVQGAETQATLPT